MSTDFKPGDRVRVEFDGTVGYVNALGQVLVRDDVYARSLACEPEHLTKYDPPVKVGDVLNREDVEPAVGTVLRYDDSSVIMRHKRDGLWYFTGADHFSKTGYEWRHVTHSELTVIYLPDAE